ncbi:MAG: MFS transporter [Proteobacteria bacterium]|nr:MFS transporter [Pseudomonadota bacterium]
MTTAPPEPSFLASRAAGVTLVMSCLYSATGITLVFLPRWLAGERGLSGAEIGILLSASQLTRIVLGPAIAFWADGHADRRTPIRLLAPAALAAFLVFFFLAHDFPTLLLTGFAALTLVNAITPLVESAALRATALGKVSYGFARGVGSISFILSNIGGGFLVARFGLDAVVVWVLVALCMVGLSAWGALKPDAPLAAPHALTMAARAEAVRSLLRSRRFVTLVVSCGLIQAAHGFYYGFSTLVWRGQGIAPETVGALWAVGVGAEVAFLWNLRIFERRLSPEALILIGAFGGAVRWTLLGFGPTGALLWLLQTLHAISFAAPHIGAMRLLSRETPENAAAMAQTLYSALSSGLLLGGASLVSGVLYDASGAHGYWAMSVMALAGGLLALGLLGAAPRTSAHRG